MHFSTQILSQRILKEYVRVWSREQHLRLCLGKDENDSRGNFCFLYERNTTKNISSLRVSLRCSVKYPCTCSSKRWLHIHIKFSTDWKKKLWFMGDVTVSVSPTSVHEKRRFLKSHLKVSGHVWGEKSIEYERNEKNWGFSFHIKAVYKKSFSRGSPI